MIEDSKNVTYERDEEDGAMVPVFHDLLNSGLQLTMGAELKRLRKVVEEKNRCIDAFKKYDEERKAYYAQFAENYDMMLEQYEQWLDDIGEELGDDVRRGVDKTFKEGLKRQRRAQKLSEAVSIVEQALPNMERVLMEIEAFAEEDTNTRKRIFYKTKVGSLRSMITRLREKVTTKRELAM